MIRSQCRGGRDTQRRAWARRSTLVPGNPSTDVHCPSGIQSVVRKQGPNPGSRKVLLRDRLHLCPSTFDAQHKQQRTGDTILRSARPSCPPFSETLIAHEVPCDNTSLPRVRWPRARNLLPRSPGSHSSTLPLAVKPAASSASFQLSPVAEVPSQRAARRLSAEPRQAGRIAQCFYPRFVGASGKPSSALLRHFSLSRWATSSPIGHRCGVSF